MTIQLPPSGDTNALTKAIETATATNQPLVLLPGVHFTKPGHNLKILIGPNGLHMSGTADAQIQRPDYSIGDHPLDPANNTHTDNNYGLYLAPARPVIPDLSTLPWQMYNPPTGLPFEFITMTSGTVTISELTLDCNMGNQSLEHLHKKDIEHSAMLVISGARYNFPSSSSGVHRVVFVGFEEVRLENLTLVRGGFADDIMFPPAYFRPNIAQVTLSHVLSEQRVNTLRGSVTFAGLSQQVAICDCNLDSLICEVDTIWSIYPGPDGPFERSLWSVDQVQTRAMGFAAKGDVLMLTASELNVLESFSINEAAGTISNSHLVIENENRRLIRLRDFYFDNCTWVLKANETKQVGGIIPTPYNDIPFSATFNKNSFVVEGSSASGQLIATGQHAPPKYQYNAITAQFINCTYQPGFGSATNPNTHVALLRERGDYTFTKADLQGLDLNQAIIAPQASVIDLGDAIRYHNP